MSDRVDKTPEARWKHLRENGINEPVNVESNDLISDKPSWLDEERFKLAKQAIKEFRVGVQYSSMTGLLLILQLPEGLEPLLVTGQSKDIPALYQRYLATIKHVETWYDDDIFNPETKGYKSIRQVRGMHKRVQSLMNDKFKTDDREGKPRIWYNSYDVAMTQFAFIGLAMLWPAKSALISATKEDLEHINYYWRVLGYLMGIKDEYNACQFDKFEDIYEFNRLMFEHEYMEKFKDQPCQTGLEMTQGICLALHYFTPLITFNGLAHWWQDCFKFNGYEPQPMTRREKVLDFWTRLSFNHLLKSRKFLKFSNWLQKRQFDRRYLNKDKEYEKLKEQYKDNTKYRFYSDRLDYFGSNGSATTTTTTTTSTNQQQQQTGHEQQVRIEQEVEVAIDRDLNSSDSNNNGNEEIVIGKCPFGFGAGLPVPLPTQQSVAGGGGGGVGVVTSNNFLETSAAA